MNGILPTLSPPLGRSPYTEEGLAPSKATNTNGSELDLDAQQTPTSKSFPQHEKLAETNDNTSQPKEQRILQGKEMCVLLVEDNEINLKLLIATMRKLKITHSTAMNGLEALNTYKSSRGKFDVIFMDISMPVMSGIDSARHIRRYERDEGLPKSKLIALTGAANPTTRQEAFSVGVDLYLTKPVPMRELKEMLMEIGNDGGFEVKS
jgi:CheY-like chemotaxis protein